MLPPCRSIQRRHNPTNDQKKETPQLALEGFKKVRKPVLDLLEDLMHRRITGPYGACLPTDFKQAQRVREQAELAAIASGFTNPERAGELAVRRALHLVEVQR